MGTAETLIVFSALMALIALVTIGIDWIGKPLKHRRFIPRLYRFDDEKLPVDEYGNTAFDLPSDEQAYLQPQPYMAPMGYAPAAVSPQVAPQLTSTHPAGNDSANATVVVPAQAQPRQVAQLQAPTPATATGTRSAFTDSLAAPDPSPSFSAAATAAGVGAAASVQAASSGAGGLTNSTIAGTGNDVTDRDSSQQAWSPGMALDMTVDDSKPSLAVKAERFWAATAQANADSHFDDEDVARMAGGKAPRRANPRTGRTEAMQLTGLRQALTRGDVRMQWPDDSVDPWSAS